MLKKGLILVVIVLYSTTFSQIKDLNNYQIYLSI